MNRDDHPGALTSKELKDLRLLARFIACWCHQQHGAASRQPLQTDKELPGHLLCSECRELLSYAIARRRACPLDPKPACKDCPIHCYQRSRRAEIRKIMRFSGRHLILRGRLDLLWHYFF
ncbi:MAG: nitrous oxide-stimulated promoter family protein [Desulfuromonadales bacterium]|nr:nitrous oxide-stimulated promoter family protein [Desulfuromonadales bacterium]